ncbi:MAG TPA: TIGR03862 family flavoprotein [Luteimonas sp.]|nr:TIGR03862 family flavoprotein [Luteimonas sp.]
MPPSDASLSPSAADAAPARARARGVVVIGGGPAGLMAAETARAAGCEVDLYEARGSAGRKFLVAGKGGLNLTHGEPQARFPARYRERASAVARWLHDFDGDALRAWARGLGVETYVGTSGRVFPLDRRAAPLLRGWVRRLHAQGVRFHVQHRWTGWDAAGALCFETPGGPARVEGRATVLALGGGSWPQLGSDGAWVPWLRAGGVAVADLQPANCGFDIGWSAHFAARHAGSPLRPVVAHWREDGLAHARKGECVVTATGIEGSLVYALAAPLREAIAREGSASLELDLAPDHPLPALVAALAAPRGHRSLSDHVRRRAGLTGAKVGLLYEVLGREAMDHPDTLATAIKRLPLRLRAPRPLAEAISTAGGVCLEGLDDTLMLAARPGTFVAGEMLDWEAPTGGYLLTACFASGRRAGLGAAAWLQHGD